MAVSTTEEWVKAAVKHLHKVKDPEERYEFVHSLIFNLALYGGYTDYEMIGILELVKQDLIDALRNAPCDCDECNKDDDDDD